MSGPNRLDVQGTHFGTHLANRDPIVGSHPLTFEQPNDFDRNVTLGNDAVHGHCIQCVDGILAKVEWENQRKDLTRRVMGGRLIKRGNYKYCNVTDHFELRRMLGFARPVPRHTAVIAGMCRLYRIDGQHADTLTALGDRYTVERVQYLYVVEQPTDVDGEITLGYRTTDHGSTMALHRIQTA